MNWKLLAGQLFDKIDRRVLKSNSSFINNNYPYRRNWIFDLKRRLPEPKVIFDIGAYIGDVSLEFNTRFPNAKIFSFEPVSASFKTFTQNTNGVQNIKGNNFALGEKEESIEIPLFSEASINTLKSANYDNPAISSEKIEVVRLDIFMAGNGIDHIDILKVDVEGFELEVLRGAGESISKIDCIVTEVGYMRSNTKTHFADIDRFLEDNGFELFNIYELRPLHNDRTRLFYSNNVYINKRLSS